MPAQPGMLRPQPADLLERLDASRGRGYRLILITAPVGSGKTTLLRQWLVQRGSVSESTPDMLRFAWLDLQPDDNRPGTFWHHWLDALGTLDPRLKQWAAASPDSNGTMDLMDAMASAINALDKAFAGMPRDFVLVLDNYHTINVPAIHAAIGLLLDYPPPALQLVIATRTEPPASLAVARLRARRLVLELGPSELTIARAPTRRQ